MLADHRASVGLVVARTWQFLQLPDDVRDLVGVPDREAVLCLKGLLVVGLVGAWAGHLLRGLLFGAGEDQGSGYVVLLSGGGGTLAS